MDPTKERNDSRIPGAGSGAGAGTAAVTVSGGAATTNSIIQTSMTTIKMKQSCLPAILYFISLSFDKFNLFQQLNELNYFHS